MENSAKIFYQYCNNASNDMFSKATTKIIEANRAIILFPWFWFNEHVVDAKKDQRNTDQSHTIPYLRENEEALIMCFEEEIRRSKIKAHKPIRNTEEAEKH